jgi:hypothetical protein
MKRIDNKILKSERVKWKDFKFIQNKNFKELTSEAFLKIKNSIMKNGFVESFKVWDNNGEIYCLDGYHRCLALEDFEKFGFNVPEQFNADFIECKNMKDAARLVGIYSSIYANVTDQGLYEFMHQYGLTSDDIRLEMDIPGIDMEKFEMNYFADDQEQEQEQDQETDVEHVEFDVKLTRCPSCGEVFEHIKNKA